MELKKTKVSIISGYYNRGDYVDDSIESLLKQTYFDIEVIVFDDCSTDSTLHKLQLLAEKDNRLVLITHPENRGFVDGIKTAVQKAKGDYIAIHGSGDYSVPTRIEKQVRVLEDNPDIGLVGCYVDNIEIVGEREISNLWKHDVSGRCLDILAQKNLFTHGEVMFRRSIYDRAGGYRSFFKFTQDYDLWTRMAVLCDFYTIPEVLYKRYLRSDGASVVPEKRLLQSVLGVVVKQNTQFIKTGKQDLVDRFGDQAIDHIGALSNVSIELLCSRMLDVFLQNGKHSSLTMRVVRILSRQPRHKTLGLVLRSVFVLPDKYGKSVVKSIAFKRLLSLAIYKLP